MATLEEADRARAGHSEMLATKGAHAVGVEDGKPFGYSGWVVVAYTFEKTTTSMPSSLKIPDGVREVYVPLVVKNEAPFEPQYI